MVYMSVRAWFKWLLHNPKTFLSKKINSWIPFIDLNALDIFTNCGRWIQRNVFLFCVFYFLQIIKKPHTTLIFNIQVHFQQESENCQRQTIFHHINDLATENNIIQTSEPEWPRKMGSKLSDHSSDGLWIAKGLSSRK